MKTWFVFVLFAFGILIANFYSQCSSLQVEKLSHDLRKLKTKDNSLKAMPVAAINTMNLSMEEIEKLHWRPDHEAQNENSLISINSDLALLDTYICYNFQKSRDSIKTIILLGIVSIFALLVFIVQLFSKARQNFNHEKALKRIKVA